MAPPETAQQIMDKKQDPAAAETARTTDSPAVDPSAIRLLLFRGGDVETCDKLAWLYMNYGVMQHAVALLEYAYETGMDELAKNGIFYGLNLPTNS